VLKPITIDVINHKDHRYETVGDYFDVNGETVIRVSNMHNWKYELLVAIHELIECKLTQARHISEKKITKFDLKFEKERKEGKHPQDAEPGFDKKAPYKREHTFATKIEKLVAKELGVNWNEYDKKVMDL
jgi:hypothetical protein